MPPPSDIVKVAVQRPGAFAQLIDLDQKKPLERIIKEVCESWNVSDSESYALQFTDGAQIYITEKNRHELKNGAILHLTFSARKTAKQLLEKIRGPGSNERLDALKQLAKLSIDVTLAVEFLNHHGLEPLMFIVEGGKELGEILAFTLTCIVELMDHGYASWERFCQGTFVKKVVSYVNKTSMDATILHYSLSLLESMLQCNNHLYLIIISELERPQLITHLAVSNQDIQTNALAVINALYMKSPLEKKQGMAKLITQKELRQTILSHVIHNGRRIHTDMAHQLHVLQRLCLNLLEMRMLIKMDPHDQSQRDALFDLRNIAFDNMELQDRHKSVYAKDYKKLGFQDNVNPAQDFMVTPPGMLALDNMLYFAHQHRSAYVRLVLENSCREDRHECPFGRSSIELTRVLCELLQIGVPPSETAQSYYAMMFTQEHAFEEFFCICIQLLNKTWKEMRATQEDFDKVIQVIREQIQRALLVQPEKFEQFRKALQALTYADILKLRQTDRMNQEQGDFKSPPIRELRETIRPEILDLIKQQRLTRLCEGTLFRRIGRSRRQDKLWCCRLSPNHKVFHYGDVDEDSSPPAIETLPEKCERDVLPEFLVQPWRIL
uniref:Engulfment and cell motility 1 (ced-12 homolog, C. elegans) n=1 Tax=Eptatretus burgeri TaxID=7764 RepID=A0A8C4WXF4_EPTBU